MSALEPSESPADFAARLLEDGGTNAWYVALSAAENETAVAHKIVEEANAIEAGFAVASVVATPGDFIAALRGAPNRLVVAAGLNAFDAPAWSELDGARSRLFREGATALVLSPASFGSLQAHAPNLASWIGGAVFELTAPPPPNPEQRLEQLRAWSKLSDEDVVAKAERGTLEPDPYFAEWLVLLGRGDLLGHR
jgi:hypothetical protein